MAVHKQQDGVLQLYKSRCGECERMHIEVFKKEELA